MKNFIADNRDFLPVAITYALLTGGMMGLIHAAHCSAAIFQLL